MGSDTEQDRSECLNYFLFTIEPLASSVLYQQLGTDFLRFSAPAYAPFSVRLTVTSIIDRYLLFFAQVYSCVAGVINGSDGFDDLTNLTALGTILPPSTRAKEIRKTFKPSR
jgi:hypothetical protein